MENNKDVIVERYLFPVDARKMLEGEKNKIIKIFLNQLDSEFDEMLPSHDKSKNKIRKLFLDCMNGYYRFSSGLLKNYVSFAEEFERLRNEISKSNRDS